MDFFNLLVVCVFLASLCLCVALKSALVSQRCCDLSAPLLPDKSEEEILAQPSTARRGPGQGKQSVSPHDISVPTPVKMMPH